MVTTKRNMFNDLKQIAKDKKQSLSLCMVCGSLFVRRDLRDPSVCSGCLPAFTRAAKDPRFAVNPYKAKDLTKRESLTEAEKKRILESKTVSTGPYSDVRRKEN